MAGIIILCRPENTLRFRDPAPAGIQGSTEEMNMPDTERESKSLMKLGAGFAVFGLVCPFFWMSLISGAPETWVYGAHSGIFILLGLVILGKGWYDLRCTRAGIPVTRPE
jgi:hypothetical protein